MPVREPSARIDCVQGLRALAALSVTVLHAQHEIGQLAAGGSLPRIPLPLGAGVDIFFVISGFIMAQTTARESSGVAAAWGFLVRRFLRVAPLYWIFTTLMVVASALLARHMDNAELDPIHILGSYLFIPVLHPSADTYQPILRVGWTLYYEMFFYALFAASLLLPRRIGLSFVLAVLTVLAAIGIIYPSAGAVELYTRTIILEFGFGILVALAFRRGWLGSARVGLSLLACSALSYLLLSQLQFSYAERGIFWGIPAALFSAAIFPLWGFVPEGVRARAVSLGDSSYILYLSHLFSIGILKIVIDKLNFHGEVGLFASAGLAAVAAAAAAHLLHLGFEKPLMKVLRRRIEPTLLLASKPA